MKTKFPFEHVVKYDTKEVWINCTSSITAMGIPAFVEKYHSKPITAWVSITKSNGEVLPNVALPVSDYGSEWNGELILYYNGTAWSKNEPTSYLNTQEIKSIQVNALVPQGITPSADIGVIEISARWVKDIQYSTRYNASKLQHVIGSVFSPIGNSAVTSNIKREVGAALALDNCRSGTARDLTVHLIGRFKSGDGSTKSGEGQENGLKNFIASVSHKHHGWEVTIVSED